MISHRQADYDDFLRDEKLATIPVEIFQYPKGRWGWNMSVVNRGREDKDLSTPNRVKMSSLVATIGTAVANKTVDQIEASINSLIREVAKEGNKLSYTTHDKPYLGPEGNLSPRTYQNSKLRFRLLWKEDQT